MKKFIINITAEPNYQAILVQYNIAEEAYNTAMASSSSSVSLSSLNTISSAYDTALGYYEKLPLPNTNADNAIVDMLEMKNAIQSRYNKLVDDELVASMNAIKLRTTFKATVTGPIITGDGQIHVVSGKAQNNTWNNINFVVVYNPSSSRTIWLLSNQALEYGTYNPTFTLQYLCDGDFTSYGGGKYPDYPSYAVNFSNIAGKSYSGTAKVATYSDVNTAGANNCYSDLGEAWTFTKYGQGTSSSRYYMYTYDKGSIMHHRQTDLIRLYLPVLVKITY